MCAITVLEKVSSLFPFILLSRPGPSARAAFGVYGVISIANAKYTEWLTEDGLLMIEGWARDGLTDEQIAGNMGISTGRLYEWKKSYHEINEALKRGKAPVDIQVENALLKKALGGDVTAMIFWLKNRKPKQWRDKPEMKADNEVLVAAKKLLEGVDSAIN